MLLETLALLLGCATLGSSFRTSEIGKRLRARGDDNLFDNRIFDNIKTQNKNNDLYNTNVNDFIKKSPVYTNVDNILSKNIIKKDDTRNDRKNENENERKYFDGKNDLYKKYNNANPHKLNLNDANLRFNGGQFGANDFYNDATNFGSKKWVNKKTIDQWGIENEYNPANVDDPKWLDREFNKNKKENDGILDTLNKYTSDMDKTRDISNDLDVPHNNNDVLDKLKARNYDIRHIKKPKSEFDFMNNRYMNDDNLRY